MKALLNKLKSRAGESLVESLAAIMIFTLSSIILYTMVATAGDILQNTKDLERQVQQELVAIEKGKAEAKTGTRTLKMTYRPGEALGEIYIAYIDIDIYGGEDGSLFTFYQKGADGE